MSEERLIYKVILVKDADGCGKKRNDFCSKTIELFKADQWRRQYRPFKRNTWPRPPIHNADEYWDNRFRIRVNGKWHNPGSSKYSFLTMDEVLKLIR